MKVHFGGRLFLAAAVASAVAVVAIGFLIALGVHSVVAGPGAGPSGPVPTPVGHAWTELQGHGVDGSGVYMSTQDDQALELRVNNARALRLEPNATSPNVIGGYSGNTVTAGAYGAAICGGGSSGFTNRVINSYGTVGGGVNNEAGNAFPPPSYAIYATVGGGTSNTASGQYATAAGGIGNDAIGLAASVGGGQGNTASAQSAAVAGGEYNEATANRAAIGGGYYNDASGANSTVAGGSNNNASASYSTIPGGYQNAASGLYSFAAGRRAKANHQGAFVWADSTDADFASTTADQFLVRANGGVSLNVTSGGLRLESNATSPNLIGGYSANTVTALVVGATISGGGYSANTNRVTDNYGTVGGGGNNQAGDGAGTTADNTYATVGGGLSNQASGQYATVGGGVNNTASAIYATIAGGGSSNAAYGNLVTDDYGTVGGGYFNQAGDPSVSQEWYATVAGGEQNKARGTRATVGGGGYNSANAHRATVGGGYDNRVYDNEGTASGGGYNRVGYDDGTTTDDTYATVGGGYSNEATAQYATIPGGIDNTASGQYSTVPGGSVNVAAGDYSFAAGRRAKANNQGAFVWADSTDADFASTTADQFLVRASGGVSLNVTSGGLRLESNATSPNVIGGYSGNTATTNVVGATIGGGGSSGNTNRVTDYHGTVGGGLNNQAGDNAGGLVDRPYATVGGGSGNTAEGASSTVGGGASNAARSFAATVAGGNGNTARGDYATVGGGYSNDASGQYSTIPGGSGNAASGSYSFAAGRRAKANHQGAFVWADSTDADFASNMANQFKVRGTGGITLVVNNGAGLTIYDDGTNLISTSTGAHLTIGGTWTNASSRDQKENFTPVDGQEVLASLADMPITTWNSKVEDPSIRHMGPVAQDFYAAFGLGDSDTSIGTLDADGVALAAIQGLYGMVQDLQTENADLEARVTALEGGAGTSAASAEPAFPGLSPWWLALLGGLVVVGLVLAQRRLAGGRP